MKWHKELIFSLSIGAVDGLIILGIIGRTSMVMLAKNTGHAVNLSSQSVLEASLFGLIAGIIGGGLLFGMRRLMNLREVFYGWILGILLLLLSTFPFWLGIIQFDSFKPVLLNTLLLALAHFIAYGLILNGSLIRISRLQNKKLKKTSK